MSSKPGANNLIYMPYLTGEQSPHFDLQCRAGFVGLSATHTKADITRAVMEGITYALRDVLTAIRESGIEPAIMRMCGGGSKSPFWRLLEPVCTQPFRMPVIKSSPCAQKTMRQIRPCVINMTRSTQPLTSFTHS